MPRSVLLLVNRSKPEAVAAEPEVRKIIESRGGGVVELDAETAPLPPSARRFDLVVVLGGDGTLLSQTRRCYGLGVPMLGVNLGKLGFMAEFDLEALKKQSDSLFGAPPLTTRDIGLLAVEIVPRGSGNPRYSGIALNEAVVTAGPPFAIIQMGLSIDGKPGPRVAGDGLIVSTAVGSTAYNLSAGGPIIQPGVDVLAVTPLAPQSLAFRPIVLSASSAIDISLHRVNGGAPAAGEPGTTLLLDGQLLAPLHEGDVVRVRKAERSVKFVVNPLSDYWSRLADKLHWAAAPRMRGE